MVRAKFDVIFKIRKKWIETFFPAAAYRLLNKRIMIEIVNQGCLEHYGCACHACQKKRKRFHQELNCVLMLEGSRSKL